jgi:glycosyltransferase involved in cell wall biosynthesis
MKLIIAAPHFHPRVGGVETYTLNLATRLTEQGWQVVVVTTGDRPGETVRAGLKTYQLPAALTVSNTPVGASWRRRLREICLAERPDVINGHTPVPFLADLAERASGPVPFVLTYHNDLYKDDLVGRAVVETLQRTIVARTLRRSTAIIATSEHYVRESKYLKGHEAKIQVVPPGVDLDTFRPDVPVSADLAAAYAGRQVIMFAGSLNKSQQYKGLDILIRAFARIRAESENSRLVVLGQGDGLPAYLTLAADAGVAADVDFPGFVPPARLAEYYRLATVFAMPSTNRTEGFGMVYAEAGAVGIPVIGARVGGVPSAVRDNETGLLVTPKSVDDLYQALRRLLDNEALRRRLGAAGAARARAELDWGTLAERTSQILTTARSTRNAGLRG